MRLLESPLVSAALVFTATLVGRIAVVLTTRFDGLYGQDAYAYYRFARELFIALTHFQAPPPFWWSLGYPTLLNLAFFFGGVNIASAQIITLLCGALVAPFAFALAYEVAPQSHKMVAGWVAALVCAVGGQLAQSSVVIMADAPALMFATAAAWLLLRYARTQSVRTLCLAALAAGFAVWTRWQNLIFAAVWLAALVSIEWEARKQSGTTRAGLQIILALALIAIVLSPQLVIRTATDAPLAGQSWLEGWRVTNMFSRSFDTVDGHLEYELPVAIFYAQVFAHPGYLVVLLTPLFLLGSTLLLRQYTLPAPSAASAAILLLGWIAAMYLFLAGIPYENFRFSLGLFPPIAIAVGLGAGWLWNRWRTSRLRRALVAWIGLALVVMLLWQPRVLAPVVESKARELNTAQWLTQQGITTEPVWTMGINGALETYTSLNVPSLWERSADELRSTAPAYFLIDTQNLETQWRGRQPEALYHALRVANALQPVSTFERWTLFRIVNRSP